MPTLRYKIKASLVATLGTLITIALIYPEEIATKKSIARSQIQTEFNWLKRDFNQQLKQLSEFFDQHQTLEAGCTESTLLALRKGHFQIPNVAEFGIVNPDGDLVCTSWGEVDNNKDISGPKPINPGKLRFFGPAHTSLIGEAALVIAKTRADFYEINALMPQSILNGHLKELDSRYTFAAIVHTNTGVPLSIVGKYSLPVNQQLFPLKTFIAQDGSTFDDLSKQFLIAEPLSNLPSLSMMIAIKHDELYKDSYSPSAINILLFAACFAGLFFLTKSYQELYRSRKSKLLHAMQTGQFINHYQLIWDSNQQKYVGMETLARQVHPVEGLLSPDRFLPEIEQNNLNIPLTCAVLDNLYADFSHSPLKLNEIKININITGEHLKDTEFHDKVIQLKSLIPNLVLELTETELVELDDSTVINAIDKFKAHKILLAIDDFGTGYAGLQYLRQLPFDILKIDRSFISAIGTESHLSKMLDALIDLAKKLNLDIVAEGVETKIQAQYLESKGVHLHQGWLYHKASPINQLPPLRAN
ncbi:EAL domain-containing protein [Thalassotalea marina]|uniref:Diguanylate phosphodiesterase n=1 Tax=Thalassotalea marina TaxID=1673741 RepID=A0A919BQB2_9GAMM|nr:EAL domain-containing protein [Thalassotalea marina]GHG02921.1 diguanylate phosphodiesterase [Thalassotalea marina]